jgi:hypothetical protein
VGDDNSIEVFEPVDNKRPTSLLVFLDITLLIQMFTVDNRPQWLSEVLNPLHLRMVWCLPIFLLLVKVDRYKHKGFK